MRLHGRIGMEGLARFSTYRRMNSQDEFDQFINQQMQNMDYNQLYISHLNIRHFLHDQPESELPRRNRNFLIYLLDEVMPFGIFEPCHLVHANDILELIKVLNDGDASIINLSNQFYATIPHSGDRARRPIINNIELYNQKTRMVEHLKSIVMSLRGGLELSISPLDHFNQNWLKSEFQRISRKKATFKVLENFINSTQHDHDEIYFEMERVFKVRSKAHSKFNNELGDHHYLIHSTYPSNVLGILRDGLMIAPGHVQGFNSFLGDGIYFWDAAAIALDRFKNSLTKDGILLVCRVALAKCHFVGPQGSFNKRNLPCPGDGYNSIVSSGLKYSRDQSNGLTLDGAQIPLVNLPKKCSSSKSQAYYNRYMVFEPNQVKVDYILCLKKIRSNNEERFYSNLNMFSQNKRKFEQPIVTNRRS